MLALFLSGLLISSCERRDVKVVRNAEELQQAVFEAQAGDKILLANGIWNDAEILLKGKGKLDQPIVISAQEKGKVFLEGQSNLRIAGEYLEVSGLIFRSGYTPSTVVISFREKSGQYARHCRLTECVIDNFNNPERFSTESWVDLYGKNNRVDHCYFLDKRCQGVTMTVRLPDEECQNNSHQIDHNYFGFRQNLGSNGGETIRIGISKYSLSTSGTVVEANYFEHTNGEHEIISVKSCGNIIRNNTFKECWGTITFRHGNDNLAEGNFFFGNGKANTGGIRIINKRNRAINNYFSGLTGTRFRGALVVMNGIPNSPVNRYQQVVGGVFSNNTFVNCDNVQLCAGSDSERSLPPVETLIENNIFYHDGNEKLFTVYDDIRGITFRNNYLSKGAEPIPGARIDMVDLQLVKNSYGLPVPVSPALHDAGCSLEKPEATAENCGPSWFVAENKALLFDRGRTIEVEPGFNALVDAVSKAKPGDRIVLKHGEYPNSKEVRVKVPLTIFSGESPLITSEKSTMFIIDNGGALKLCGLQISGEQAPDMAGNVIVASSKYAMNRNYKLFVENCSVRDLTVNHSFSFFKSNKNTFADSVIIRNSDFENVTGYVAELNAEPEDLGVYNAENVILSNSNFIRVQGTVINLYRGGTDESTFGPVFKMNNCVVEDTGLGARNKSKACLYLHGVQRTDIEDCSFIGSAPIKLFLANGEPVTKIESNKFWPEIRIVSNDNNYREANNILTVQNYSK